MIKNDIHFIKYEFPIYLSGEPYYSETINSPLMIQQLKKNFGFIFNFDVSFSAVCDWHFVIVYSDTKDSVACILSNYISTSICTANKVFLFDMVIIRMVQVVQGENFPSSVFYFTFLLNNAGFLWYIYSIASS